MGGAALMTKWYKRDPDAWRGGVVGLTLEERGAYDTVIDVLMSCDGSTIDNSDRFWARQCNCNPRTWRRVRNQLMVKGKVWWKPDGQLMAKRVEYELNDSRMRAEWSVNANRKRWKNNTKGSPAPESNPHPDSIYDSPSGESYIGATPSAKRPRARRSKSTTAFPEPWPSLIRVEDGDEFQRFKDWALKKDARYADWQAAWRNWLSSPYRKSNGGNQRGRRETVAEMGKRLADECRKREQELGNDVFRTPDNVASRRRSD
jgi:uncharacterized protein YdaU (DUF1376 family)